MLKERKPFVRRYMDPLPGHLHTIVPAAERDRTRKAYISIRVIKTAHLSLKCTWNKKQNAPRSHQVIMDVTLLTLRQ